MSDNSQLIVEKALKHYRKFSIESGLFDADLKPLIKYQGQFKEILDRLYTVKNNPNRAFMRYFNEIESLVFMSNGKWNLFIDGILFDVQPDFAVDQQDIVINDDTIILFLTMVVVHYYDLEDGSPLDSIVKKYETEKEYMEELVEILSSGIYDPDIKIG